MREGIAMRTFLALAVVLAFAVTATGQELGTQAPIKAPAAYFENVPDPTRQGGDTIASATFIPSLPYNDAGTTTGFIDDYDAVCPYSGATAPDVVYRYVPPAAQNISIDLCGSSFDTKLYVYDGGLNLIACNDDYYFGSPCGVYVSKLENIPVAAGQTYYIVIDGYGSASGNYMLDVTPFDCCIVVCPDDGVDEGEPPLVNDYVDSFNGGCNTPGYPFQNVQGDAAGERIICGMAGWYLYQGSSYRDTDWFILIKGPAGAIEIAADAESATYLFELGPQDCGAVGVLQQTVVGPVSPGSMTITGYDPGEPVWFWVGSTVFAAPGGGVEDYDYVVWFTGLEPVVATAAATWSTIKALYD